MSILTQTLNDLNENKISVDHAEHLILDLFSAVKTDVCTYPKHPSFDENKCKKANNGCDACIHIRRFTIYSFISNV
jgi:hypothetical protein